MTFLTVPSELAERLSALTEPATIVDENGRVLGRFIPAALLESPNDRVSQEQKENS
jgi:hypothetical protein